MTISISEQAYDELFAEMTALAPTFHPDQNDTNDFMGNFPPVLGQGYWRTIKLREGLEVTLGNLQMRDHVKSDHKEDVLDYLEFHYHLSGTHDYPQEFVSEGKYSFSGIGLEPKISFQIWDKQPFLEVIVLMHKDLLSSLHPHPSGGAK